MGAPTLLLFTLRYLKLGLVYELREMVTASFRQLPSLKQTNQK